MNKERILEAIYKAIDKYNLDRSIRHQIKKTPKSVLIGDGGKLDSMGFVIFMVEVEKAIKEEFRINLNLSEGVLSEKESPLETIQSLANYIYSKEER